MRKLLINKDGLVMNAIEIEDGANWSPPAGCGLMDEKKGPAKDEDGNDTEIYLNIGDTWKNERIIKKIGLLP